MVVRYQLHNKKWMEVFRAYQATWDSPSVQGSDAAADRCLKQQVLYLVLSKYDNEQSDQMHALQKEKRLAKLPLYDSLLKAFITKEVFKFEDVKPGVAAELVAIGDFDEGQQKEMLETLHRRVTQHNILTIGGYYARIQLSRLAQLLALPLDEAEKQLCEMVSDKSIYARVDRRSLPRHRLPPVNEGGREWRASGYQRLKEAASSKHSSPLRLETALPTPRPTTLPVRPLAGLLGLCASPRRRRQTSCSTTGRMTSRSCSTRSSRPATSSTRRTWCTRSDRGGPLSLSRVQSRGAPPCYFELAVRRSLQFLLRRFRSNPGVATQCSLSMTDHSSRKWISRL